jgi:glucose/arabinose dehydrogenase
MILPAMHRTAAVAAILVLVLASCADDTVAPTTAAPTTAAPSTTAVPTTSTTIPPTTAAPTTTTTTLPATTTTTLPPLQGLAYEVIATDLPFPIFAAAVPGDGTLWFLERGGRISRLDSDGMRQVVLDLTDRVNAFGIENGLLGIAFHPDFTANGRLFIYYTDGDLDSHVAEFAVVDGEIDPASERLILEVIQPFDRHKAGMLEFGPDGLLYISLGDGATGGDRAADPFFHHGSILRIDVDSGDPYGIPPNNPFADGEDGLPEIWAMGLRNPWRFSIDDGLIYIGDVGQETLEEIDVVPLDHPAPNLGWPGMEGTSCYFDQACEGSGAIRPVVEHTHEEGCSITGGYVYRGSAIPELYGHYFFSDWCGGWVRSFRFDGEGAVDQHEWSELERIGSIAAFARDADGELLVITSEGIVARIVPVR